MQKDTDALKNCYIGTRTVKLADSIFITTKLTELASLSSQHLYIH